MDKVIFTFKISLFAGATWSYDKLSKADQTSSKHFLLEGGSEDEMGQFIIQIIAMQPLCMLALQQTKRIDGRILQSHTCSPFPAD